MKKLLSLILALIFVSGMLTVYAADTSYYYVAVNGLDSSDGSVSAPFATLNKAIEAARADKAPSVIYISAGEYKFTDTIELTAEDSNLTICAAGGAKVSFDGGTKIPLSAFSKVTDTAVLNRIIEQNGKDNVLQADTKAVGINDMGEMTVKGFGVGLNDEGYYPTLAYKDKMLDYAQYPNGKEYLRVNKVIRNGEKSEALKDNRVEIEFALKDDRFKKWASAEEMWALGWFKFDWAEAIVPAKVDKSGSIVTYTNKGYLVEQEKRVKFFNMLEEIDAPGEWYLNRQTGILYLIPPEGMSQNENVVFNSFNKNMININGAENINIVGIRFANTRKCGLNVENSKNIVIDNCELTGIGDTAVTFNNSTDSGIKNSYIHDVGSKGVSLNGGDRQTLTPGNLFCDNCHIEAFMRIKRTYAPGISMGGVGNRASHNEINDAPHEAIGYGGNDMIIEYNNIYNVCTDSADCGAIYTGRNWTTRGNEIRYNYFHDLAYGSDGNTGRQVHAVYLDDCHAATAVYSNIFSRCSSVALYGGGRDNTFINNIMIDCINPFTMDNRGLGWRSYTNAQEMGVYAVPYKEGAWKGKYPHLDNLLEDEPLIPKYNTIKDNVMYKTPEMALANEVKEYGTVENNITISKSTSFVDYRAHNFNVAPDSEIYQKIPDFKAADFTKIGRQEFITNYDFGGVQPDNSIKVLLNGKKLDFDVQPAIINDRTMVPLRVIFEALGTEVGWDDATKTISATKGNASIAMQIDNPSMTVNGVVIPLDSAPVIVDSRTLVPVRAIAEAFGCKVGWNGETRTVTIDQ